MNWKDLLNLGPAKISKLVGCAEAMASDWCNDTRDIYPEQWVKNMISRALEGWKPDDALDGFIECYLRKPWEVDGKAHKHIKKSILYQAYTEWCEVEGLKPMSNKILSRQLKARGWTEWSANYWIAVLNESRGLRELIC